ncbi:MAG: DUF2911 domain-containing protein [Candidatus Sulfotelmatobacter sp.]
MQKKIALVTLFLLTVTGLSFSQMGDKSKRPSPPESATCDVGNGQTIKTDYSSPRMKGREIFGGLVPYGKVWRTGANEATTFVPSTEVEVGGKNVPAGSYTIFTVPNQNEWTLIINKKTGEWGIPYKYESDELARVPMKVSKLDSPMENFTISYEKSGSGCTMNIEWATTKASVEIKAK